MRNFRKFEVWTEGLKLVKEIYLLTASFPIDERFGLKSQMNRSVVSIPSNIAEGCSRSSSKEFSRFIEIALGSSFELETQIEILKLNDLIPIKKYDSLLVQLNTLQKRLNALKNSIKD
jgi:four helix bundle protein